MIPPRRELAMASADWASSHLLEVFEVGSSGTRHAVWLHRLKAGGFRWRCSCGAQRIQHELDAVLLAEARAHFDQAWEPAAVPIGHFASVWNDRVMNASPPSAEDLARLAQDLANHPIVEAQP